MTTTINLRAPAAAASGFPVLALFSLTLLLSAFLLFSIQPFFAKMVLPRLGGSPAVWSIAMVFFQGVLLLGYGYAHLLTTKLNTKQAVAVHGLVLLVAFAALPVAIPESWGRPPETGQAVWLLGLFAVSVGLPFFAVSANGPLLQAWFARTGHPHAADPYFLYGASNIGSLASLILFIVLFEPLFTVPEQGAMWMRGFALLAGLILLCALPAVLRPPLQNPAEASPAARTPRLQILRWMALAFVPSGLLVAVTAHISMDVAAAPFLWVMPLILFLLTFVIAFQRRPLIQLGFLSTALPWAAAVALIGAVAPTSIPIAIALAVHLAFFFLAALLCHSVLVSQRPPAENLTGFYFWMSFGGVLGGVFASLIAPATFNWIAEYPLLIIAAALCRPGTFSGERRHFPIQAAIVLLCGWLILSAASAGLLPHLAQRSAATVFLLTLIIIGAIVRLGSNRAYVLTLVFLAPLIFLVESSQGELFAERSFFGVVKVSASADGTHRLMTHGTTVHGAMAVESLEGAPPIPLTYYHETGGMALAIASMRERRGGAIANVGIVGLGTGSILCHRRPGERWTSYEIDAGVVRVASDPALFRFISQCGNGDPIVIGDGRLRLEEEPDRKYDVLIIDAFASDSIPAHLMTREAVELYRSKLARDGLLVMHISNRHLELASVISAIGEELGMVVRAGVFGKSGESEETYVLPNHVAVLANNEADLGSLSADPRWSRKAQNGTRPWTDDYSDIIGALWRAL